MPEKKIIYVTRPSLPPLEEYSDMLNRIWDCRILTNNGPFHQQFETELALYLGVSHVSLFANGTLALMAALRVLGISGEVITTPYSFVATTHALWWNNIKPVFADVDPVDGNISPECVEKLITPKTTAILPVHVYGNPCLTEQLDQIGKKHGLKIIYDACHSFGVKIGGSPVVSRGDLSVLSFHATKVFNTFEGGAVVCHDIQTKKQLDFLKNFGFAGETEVVGPGINAKMNELQAAMGILQLKYVDDYIIERRRIATRYREELAGIPGLRTLCDMPGVRHCYSYFPVFVDKKEFGITRDELYEGLRENDIYGRRYFFPLISEFTPYDTFASSGKKNLHVADQLSKQVICLPIYPGLEAEDQRKVIATVKKYSR